MTDFSKIRTIEELDFQTQRMQRRAGIQRERINGHIDYIVREWHYLTEAVNQVLTPVRNTINKYRHTFNVIGRIIRAFLPRR